MSKWDELSYEARINVLHKLAHDHSIPAAALPGIMALVGYDTDTLRVYNYDGRPGAIQLYNDTEALNIVTLMDKLQRLADEIERQLADWMIRMIKEKMDTLHEIRRADFPDVFWAACEMHGQWMHKHAPPEMKARLPPPQPWPDWLPRKLRRPIPQGRRPMRLLTEMMVGLYKPELLA